MNTKAEILAKKLLALAKQGVGGEAVNAEQMLKNHCAKHGINIEDLEEDRLIRYEFTLSKGSENYRILFFQIVANIIPDYSGSYYKRAGMKVAVDCTAADAFEIKFKFEHYLKEYKKSEKDLYTAFIIAGNLWANSTKEAKKFSELSIEEKHDILRAEKLASGLNVAKLQKRLGE